MDRLLWSIALPGFGQILNGHYWKGAMFIFLEFLVNLNSNFNDVILLSFNGRTVEAIQQTDYGWLMFYPCLYFFAMWDAYKENASLGKFSYIPFVAAAYLGTVGLVFSPSWKIFGLVLGPVWLTMIFALAGSCVGWMIKLRLEQSK